MALLSRLLAAVTATATATALALAAPLAPRGAVGSKDIVGLPQTVPAGPIGDLYLAYQPYLDVVNGCVPFPAVDAAGNTKSVPDRVLPATKLVLLCSHRTF